LLKQIDARLAEHDAFREYTLPITAGEALAWLYRHGEVLSRKDLKKTMKLRVMLGEDKVAQFEKKFLNSQ
jgi:GTP-binding protein HflX